MNREILNEELINAEEVKIIAQVALLAMKGMKDTTLLLDSTKFDNNDWTLNKVWICQTDRKTKEILQAETKATLHKISNNLQLI